MTARALPQLHVSELREWFGVFSGISLVLTAFFVPLSVAGTNICLIAAMVLGLFTPNYKQRILQALQTPAVRYSLLFFLWCAISLSYTQASLHTGMHYLHKYMKLAFVLFLLPVAAEKRWRDYALNAFILVMVVTALCSYLKAVGLVQVGTLGNNGDIFKNHIETSFMMSFATFVLAHRYLQQKQWWQIALASLMLVQIFCLNGGRTGYVTAIILIGLFCWQIFRWRGVLAAVIAVPMLLGGAYMMSSTFKYRIGYIKHDLVSYNQHDLKSNSVGLRLAFAKNSFELVKGHEMLGLGLGSFRQAYYQRFGIPPEQGGIVGDPHNEYIHVLLQLGIVGLGLFLLLLTQLWRSTSYLAPSAKPIAQGLIVAFAVGSLCDSFLFLTTIGHFFIVMLALIYPSSMKMRRLS